MDPSPRAAPSDHFSPQRSRLRELESSLATLRKRLPFLNRLASGMHVGAISACAALGAYVPMHLLGLREGYWSAMTAVSVVQTEFQATQTTARDQLVGAAIGGTIGVGGAVLLGQDLVSYALAVVVSILVCWLLNVPTAARLAGTTTTIMLLVPHAGSPERMFGARLLEVGWGLGVAVAIVWIAGRLPGRQLARMEKRITDAAKK